MAEHKQNTSFGEFTGAGTNRITTTGINPALASGDTLYPVTSVIIQGAANGERIGDKITGTSLKVKVLCYGQSGVITQWQYRIIGFVWKDDTQPVYTDVLIQAGGGLNTPDQPYNLDKKVKSKVLFDRCIACSREGVGVWNNPNIQEFNVNLSALKRGNNIVNFQAGSQLAVNHIYLLLTSNLPIGTSNSSFWTMVVTVDYRYIDM